MAEDKIYSSVLDYMCENYDYSLYATDFNTHYVAALQRSIASISSPVAGSRTLATKTALEDFFNAIFQKVFVYEDEDRLKIVKYFDEGALNEKEDKQIHTLRQELVKYKDEVESTFYDDSLYMFDKTSRKSFESALLPLSSIPIKDILRQQVALVFDLAHRDIVVFLNAKIFLKKFKYIDSEEDVLEEEKEIFYDKRFVDSLWEEVSEKLNNSFENGFDFLRYEPNEFYENCPLKFFSIIKAVVKNAFTQMEEENIIEYSSIVFKSYKPRMLLEVVKYIYKEVLQDNLQAIKFLKAYSESTRMVNHKMKLDKAPLIDSAGRIYKYKNILDILKYKELLNSKIIHKTMEIKNLQKRVQQARTIAKKSEDEMETLQKRRLELLLSIKKVEDDLRAASQMKILKSIDINRLEFSKRNLLDAFKQVEVRSRTQENIFKNTHIELDKWLEKKNEKVLLKESLKKENIEVFKNYTLVCELLVKALNKEQIEF